MIHMLLFKVSLLGTVSSRVAWLFPKYMTNLECNKYIFDYHPQSFNSIYTNWKFFLLWKYKLQQSSHFRAYSAK